MLRRSLAFVAAIAVGSAACGDASVLTPAPTERPASSLSPSTAGDPAPAPSATSQAPADPLPPPDPSASDPSAGSAAPIPDPVEPDSGPTDAPGPATPGPDLMVRQVLLSYDGETGLGSFEPVVCNVGELHAPGSYAVVTIGPTQARLPGPDLAPGTCSGFRDPAAHLETFGVGGPGPVPVVAEIEGAPEDPAGNNLWTGELMVPALSMAAPADQLASYRECLASYSHRECVGRVAGHPIPEAGEVMKVWGDFRSIAPARFENLAVFFVSDDAQCLDRMESWLGVAGPRPVVHRLVVADDFDGGYALPFVAMYAVGSESRWQQALADQGWWWSGLLDGYCSNAHELTHLILGETPMPSWLNEGLATYMEDTGRSGDDTPQPVECREGGWYGRNYEGVLGEFPFQDLMSFDPGVPGIYYYYTAMCFWDYLDREYGVETVQQILRATVAYRDPAWNGCELAGSVYFIGDIVNPALGFDIGPMTSQRWGFGSTFTACEG